MQLNPKRHRRGFTLVELLVVIAIIALLIAIILPSISRARKSAQNVACMSNLRGWAQAIALYTTENRARYWIDWGNYPPPGTGQGTWMRVLSTYYRNLDRFRLCPAAEEPTNTWGSLTFMSWGPIPQSAGFLFDPKDSGSYGINHWVNDLPKTGPFIGGWRNRPELQWRRVGAAGLGKATTSPLIGDCEWYGGNPMDFASATTFGAVTPVENALYKQTFGMPNSWFYDLSRFAMNRHNKGINMAFEDGSVRHVDKSELWMLNWYKGFRAAKVSVPY
jgi:prepilin-type N-terminal cleavage/methylation domain-containing protein/prepilin-type processing-associated H-X9-DG protein